MKLMGTRTILSKTVGLIQAAIGVTAMVFAFLAFYNVFGIQTMLGVSAESIGLYLWIFIIFGLLSTISGLFLFYEQSA
jgi:hypothetical protein